MAVKAVSMGSLPTCPSSDDDVGGLMAVKMVKYTVSDDGKNGQV